MEERTGVVTVKGGPVTLVGPEIKVGDKAPDFTVVDNGLQEVSSGDFAGKKRLISVTPSLDTPVCDAQARRFNEEAAKQEGVEIINISMDLPFANTKFCSTAGIENIKTFSDHRDASFSTAFGVLIKELRIDARAIFVIGEDDTVKYAEVVPELVDAPDYDAALAALA